MTRMVAIPGHRTDCDSCAAAPLPARPHGRGMQHGSGLTIAMSGGWRQVWPIQLREFLGDGRPSAVLGAQSRRLTDRRSRPSNAASCNCAT
jgi:hypothetical protein